MLDTLTSENYRDFSQRYRNTFGWLVNKNKEIPIYIREVSDTTVAFQSLTGEEYFAYADKEVIFKFMPLKRRITIGVDGAAYVVSRHPARQWRRGVCADNTRLYKLQMDGPRSIRVDVATINNLIAADNPKTLPNVVKLSDQFAVVGSIVYLYEYLIGTFNATTHDIVVEKKYLNFVQELRDAIRNSGLNYRILND